MREHERLFSKRNPKHGGVSALLTGEPGCGKSNALALIASKETDKKIYLIWRMKNTCQWSIITHTKCKLLFHLKAGLEYKLFNKQTDNYSKFGAYGRVKKWTSPEELILNLELGCVNVVQTLPHSAKSNAQQRAFVRDWIEIFDALVWRKSMVPVTLIFDEVEDLCPFGKTGFFHTNTQVTDILKEMRKTHINFFAATHRATEIHWTFLNKIQWMIYMKGAKPRQGSSIYAKRPAKLPLGHAIIEGSFYEDFKFSFVGEEKHLLCEVTIPDDKLNEFTKEDEKEKELQLMKALKP
jgi:hypothetical protein